MAGPEGRDSSCGAVRTGLCFIGTFYTPQFPDLVSWWRSGERVSGFDVLAYAGL